MTLRLSNDVKIIRVLTKKIPLWKVVIIRVLPQKFPCENL